MAFRKTQKVEKVEVGTPTIHVGISKIMSKLGKKSATELDEEERKKLSKQIDGDIKYP